MPKKQPKNAFFYFMQSFREEQKRQGILYEDTRQVAEAAGLPWKEASPDVRAKFALMAKNARLKSNLSDEKYTSYGVPLSHVAMCERERVEAEESEREDIINMIRSLALNKNLQSQDFYIMDVNCFCKAGSDYLIGEFTVLRFSLEDGVKDTYHEMVNPGKIPLGYTFDVKTGCEEYALEMPDDSNCSNFIQILAYTVDYLKHSKPGAKVLPPVFTMPDKVEQISNFLTQMCHLAGEDEALFRVYKLNTLFFNMANIFSNQQNEGFPKESLALMQLKKDTFRYNPGIGCAHHEEIDKSEHCCLSRAKRWCYTILDLCCGLASIPLVPGKHVPQDYDMANILSCQDQKKKRLGSNFAGLALSSCNTTLTNESLDTTTYSTLAKKNVAKKEKVHVPLRMPKADHSKIIVQAPELTEDEFPSLASRGRGRGMGRSFFKN